MKKYVVFVVVMILFSAGCSSTSKQSKKSEPERSETVSHVDKKTKVPKEEKITLNYGQLGEYGKSIILDGEIFINYHVPEGSYLVTNNGKVCVVFIAEDAYFKNSDGYMENDIVERIQFSYAGEKRIINIAKDQHIELSLQATITLTKQD